MKNYFEKMIDNEDEYWVIWNIISSSENEFEIELKVKNEFENSFELYLLIIEEPKEYMFTSSDDGSFCILDENNPLIKNYVENRCSLYYKISNEQKLSLLDALLKTHIKIIGKWIDPFKFLNSNNFGLNLLEWDSGKLAEGPQFLIESYRNAIDKLCINTSIINHGPPKDWNGSEFISRDKELKGISFGTSYILCKDFKINQLTNRCT